MARPKKPQANPDTDLFLGVVGLSANQVVAYNLAQARMWRSWTQEQSAEAIEPYLGVRWSKGSVSQAERSVDGNFIRNFSADEIVAFAQAFELPITWFFMPPGPVTQSGGHALLVARDGTNPQPLAALLDLVFGTSGQQADLTLRLQGWLQMVSPETLTDAQQQVTAMATGHVTALLRNSLRQLRQWQTSLHDIANHLEDLEVAAKQALANETDVPVTELDTTQTVGLLNTIDIEGGETADPPSTATAPSETGATRTRARKDRTASAGSGQSPDGAARAGITTSGERPARRTEPPAIGR